MNPSAQKRGKATARSPSRTPRLCPRGFWFYFLRLEYMYSHRYGKPRVRFNSTQRSKERPAAVSCVLSCSWLLVRLFQSSLFFLCFASSTLSLLGLTFLTSTTFMENNEMSAENAHRSPPTPTTGTSYHSRRQSPVTQTQGLLPSPGD